MIWFAIDLDKAYKSWLKYIKTPIRKPDIIFTLEIPPGIEKWPTTEELLKTQPMLDASQNSKYKFEITREK